MEPVEYIGTGFENILPPVDIGYRLADEGVQISFVITLQEVADGCHIASNESCCGIADHSDFILPATAEDLDLAESLVIDDGPAAVLLLDYAGLDEIVPEALWGDMEGMGGHSKRTVFADGF
jgi:hypothetical protein